MPPALFGTAGRRRQSAGTSRNNQQEERHGRLGSSSENERRTQPSQAAYPPDRTDNRNVSAKSAQSSSRRTTGSAASSGGQPNQSKMHHQHKISASTTKTRPTPASRPIPAQSDCRGILDALITTASSSRLSVIGSNQNQKQNKPPTTEQQQSSPRPTRRPTRHKAAPDARSSTTTSTKPLSKPKSKLDMIRQELKTEQTSTDGSTAAKTRGRNEADQQHQPDKPSRTDKQQISTTTTTEPTEQDRKGYAAERSKRHQLKAIDEYENDHHGNQDDAEAISFNSDNSCDESDDESPELDEHNLEMDKSVHYALHSRDSIGRNGSIKLAVAVDSLKLRDDNDGDNGAESAMFGGSVRFGIPTPQQQHHQSNGANYSSNNTANKSYSPYAMSEPTSSLLSASMRFGTRNEDAANQDSTRLTRALSSSHSFQASAKSLDSSTSASSAKSFLSNYPQFMAREICLGEILGKGSFGVVREVLAFDIINADAEDAAGDERDGMKSSADINQLRSEGMYRRRSSYMSSTHSISNGDEGRAFLARHCIRSKAANTKPTSSTSQTMQLPTAPQEPQESCESHRTLVCTEDAATRKRVQARLGLPSSSSKTPTTSSRSPLQVFKSKARSRLTRSGQGDCRYAVKQLREELLDDKKSFNLALQDIINETNILAKIRHPNIVKLRAFGRADGAGSLASDNRDGNCHPCGYFIVLDRLYDTLSRRIAAWSKQKEKAEKSILWSSGIQKMRELWMERIVVAYDIASALSYLHSMGIAYRDLVSVEFWRMDCE